MTSAVRKCDWKDDCIQNLRHHRVEILTCQHCRTKVAVGSDCICPSCRKPTTDVPLSIAEDRSPPAVFPAVQIPDTNRGFGIASFFCAGLQIVLLIYIAITHRQPVAGGNPLEHLAGFVGVFTTIAVTLPLQVIGSAFGLGAGSFKIPCIVFNMVCCAICVLLSLILLLG